MAQLGATLGREFSYELLQAVSPVDEETLQQALTQLVAAEVLYQRGLPPQATLPLQTCADSGCRLPIVTQEQTTAVSSADRQSVGGTLPETKETQPELLAHHYTEASLIAQAIPYWQKAGQSAIQRSANAEAISHLTKGLELLKPLPDTPERTQQELPCKSPWGPLIATKGQAAPEVERSTPARASCASSWEKPRSSSVTPGVAVVLSCAGGVQDRP